MDHPHQLPAHELAQAGARVAAGDLQQIGDLLGVERPLGEVEERVRLRHGAIDAPARPHLAPVKDEALRQRGERTGGH